MAIKNLRLLFQYAWYCVTEWLAGHPTLTYDEWFYVDFGEYEESRAWLCVCGHYQEDDLHCSYCGAEPPWGCDCSFCDERAHEDRLTEMEWLAAWGEDYPHELLVDDLDFEY